MQTQAEKSQALMRIQQAEQTAEQAFEETGSLLEQVNDLKDRAQQVSVVSSKLDFKSPNTPLKFRTRSGMDQVKSSKMTVLSAGDDTGARSQI